jgi:hypothetical protein
MQIRNLFKFEPAGQTAYCIGFLAMSKNVAKAHVAVQITANHYTLYYANNSINIVNAWLHAYIIN